MTFGLLGELFVFICFVVFAMSNTIENDIRNKIVKHLGMKSLPDMRHANVSAGEFSSMLSVYQQSVRQTEGLRELRRHFDTHVENTHEFDDVILYSDSKHNRRRRSSPTSRNRVEMIHFNSSIFPRLTLVTAARLEVQLGFVSDDCKVTAVQAVNGSDGITLDSLTLASDDQISLAELDVTHAIQAWILDPTTNKGILLISEGCEVEMTDVSGDKAAVHLVMEQVSRRQKRSQGRTKRKHPKKCRRREMKVSFGDLEGFDFIYMPREFDASICRGKCPPRYRPMNDHSLLQSLMFIKSDRNARKSGGKSKIKKPCCSPSKFENLDILHLDEKDPTRLKVTNWKNIKVSHCACA